MTSPTPEAMAREIASKLIKMRCTGDEDLFSIEKFVAAALREYGEACASESCKHKATYPCKCRKEARRAALEEAIKAANGWSFTLTDSTEIKADLLIEELKNIAHSDEKGGDNG